ncbi:MAG: nucleotidyltransferase domain-containing protein [Planctomycetes bacterium]|nr:nucleotidyltransferase domain-containing protein [Planctomycetota bacterium]
MEREQVASIVRGVVAASPRPIAAAWLYGSVARGTAKAGSDVDVALLMSSATRLGASPSRSAP